MATDDSLSRVANTAVLAGFSLAMVKLMYPQKVYEKEKARRSKTKKQKK